MSSSADVSVNSTERGAAWQSTVSAVQPDWSRETKRLFEWSPTRSLLASVRAYQRYRNRRDAVAFLLSRLAVLRHRFWSVVTGAEIPLQLRCGGGLVMPHPNGIVIHPEVEVGSNCLIFQQVTIGVAKGGVPKVGGHVDIGAGAKVLGPITIGDHCEIGANAVVLTDMPPYSVAVGIPARIILRGPRTDR